MEQVITAWTFLFDPAAARPFKHSTTEDAEERRSNPIEGLLLRVHGVLRGDALKKPRN
jgi:hypothetical protein